MAVGMGDFRLSRAGRGEHHRVACAARNFFRMDGCLCFRFAEQYGMGRSNRGRNAGTREKLGANRAAWLGDRAGWRLGGGKAAVGEGIGGRKRVPGGREHPDFWLSASVGGGAPASISLRF